MKNLFSILYINFFSTALLIGMSIAVLSNKSMQRKVNLYFLSIIIAVFISNICDMANYYLSGFDHPNFWRYFTSATVYSVRPIILLFIIRILMRQKKFTLFLWVPIIISAIISYTTYFTHLMYWFNENNVFQRGPLSYLSHIISAIYLVFLVIATIKQHKYLHFAEFLITIYIVVISILSTLMESILGYRFLLSSSIIISITIYYIFICSQSYKYDSLTGLLNRASFCTDTQGAIYKPMVIISIDMNGLKKINDTQGHKAGDKALQSLSDILLQHSAKPFQAYRTGGDEFFIIGKGESIENATILISTIKKDLKNYNLTASFGCAMFNPNDNFDEICKIADSNMYEDKKHTKVTDKL